MTAITAATSTLMTTALPMLKAVQGGEAFLKLIGKQLDELGCVVFKGEKGAGAAKNFEAYLKQGDLKDTPWIKIEAKHADTSPHSTVFIPLVAPKGTGTVTEVGKASDKFFNEVSQSSALAAIEGNLQRAVKGELALGNPEAIALMNASPLVKSGIVKSQGNGLRDKVVKEVFILNPGIDGRQLTYGQVHK